MIIFLTGGGSGGHILPNLALLPLLQKQGISVRYLGERSGMEQTLVQKAGIPFHGILAGKLRRYPSFRTLMDFFKIPIGFLMALLILIRHRPAALFSKGGYVALPVCFAAWVLRIPIVIHESDVRPGLTTCITSRLATHICVSWKETQAYFGKSHYTGVPVRTSLLQGSKKHAHQLFCDMDATYHENALPTLLVIGGSLGAQFLNELISTHHVELRQIYNIIHITGEQGTPILAEGKKGGKTGKNLLLPGWYLPFSFVGDELGDIYAQADIILSRAGATALAEYAALHKRCILVPLPTTVSRGDQLDNAQSMQKSSPDLVRIILQEELTLPILQASIQDLLHTKTATHPQDKQHAADKIMDLLLTTARAT